MLYGIALLQDSSAGASALGAGLGIGFMLFWLAIAVLMIASLWKVFEKAGEPGWAAIVPIYNAWVLVKVAGKPPLWFILLLVPFVNFIAAIFISLAIAERFGKSAGFGIGLAFLPFIFYPMLAFSASSYTPAPAMA